MTYKSILVNLAIDGPVAPLTRLAMDLAHSFDARLIGLSAADIQPPIADASGMGIDLDIIDIQIKQIESRLQAVQAEFEALAGGTVDIQWRGAVCRPTSFLLEQARAADLLVASSSTGTSPGNGCRHIDLGSLVLHAGRPVFVAGDGVEHISTNRILVAWKDTREARRAVADALPLLSRAQEVVVVTIDPEEDSICPERAGRCVRLPCPPWHQGAHRSDHGQERRRAPDGIRQVDPCRHRRIGRLRPQQAARLVFGGVTRSLLKDGGLNRFMTS